MFKLFSWVTVSVRGAVLAGFNQALQVLKTGEPGDSSEGQRLLELMDGQEPLNRLLDHDGNGKRGKVRL